MSEAGARKVDGYLTVVVTPSNRKDGLARRVAMVWKDGEGGRQLVAPLFDASILSLDRSGVLTLRGIELHSGWDEARGVSVMAEHHQVWRCRPMDGTRMREH